MMIDREKVIRGLECCSFAWNIEEPPNCKNCPYTDAEFGTCQIQIATLIDDALELLKKDQIELAELQATLDLANGKLINMGYEAYNCDDGRDALENAIKAAQEPRVLTLDELKECMEYYMDEKGSNKYDVLLISIVNDAIEPFMVFNYEGGCVGLNISDYGKDWRCWSSKPTDKQREAVKWDA